MGKVVALCQSGIAGIGDDVLEVYDKAVQKYKGPFYFRSCLLYTSDAADE